jgi:predicted PurR-regulated permease PerM
MKESQRWSLFIGLIVLGWLVYSLSPVLTPFIVGAFLAYLTDPLVNRLQSWKVPRTLAAILVFVSFGALLATLMLLIVPMLEEQVQQLFITIPAAFTRIEASLFPWLHEKLSINLVNVNVDWIKQNLAAHWQQAGGVAATVIKTLSHSGRAVFTWVVNLLLIPVVMFYLLRDWDQLGRGLQMLIPRRMLPTVLDLFYQCDDVLSAFIRGQLMVMCGLGFLYFFGMFLVGLRLALLIGMAAGLMSIVPYLGFIVGITAASLAAVVQFHDWLHVILIWVVFIIAQTIEATTLTPWLLGDRIGLHPVAVIFAVLAGGQLFGFIGVLLALPVSAVIMVFIRYLKQRYVESNLYMKQAKKESE